MDEACSHGEGNLCLPIQILISSRNILIDTSRIICNQVSGLFMTQSSWHIKLSITHIKLKKIITFPGFIFSSSNSSIHLLFFSTTSQGLSQQSYLYSISLIFHPLFSFNVTQTSPPISPPKLPLLRLVMTSMLLHSIVNSQSSI